MAERRRGSISLWQTELFIVVIVVAMLVLSGSLSAGLRSTLTQITETTELRNASALAQRLEPEFPLQAGGSATVRDVVNEYRDIYGGGIWVYDAEGTLLESAFDTDPGDAVLESARLGALDEREAYAASTLRPNGWVVASKTLRGDAGDVEGTVVTASSVEQPVAILRALRDRLWVTFWVSLVIAGLLGFGFARLISRRITAMSDAAAAIAAGDFEQRLPTGLVPGEVQDLAVSYNTMAATLGEAFGEIEESRRQIAAVVESMAEGVVAFDSDGVVRVTNPEALRLLGAPEGDLIGAPLETIAAESEVVSVVRAGLQGESTAETVALGHCIVLLHCTPLLEETGEVDGAVLLLADVTERHRIEDAQRRFVADASHEMRTPIAALKGMLELLADGAKEVPAVRDDFISTMQVEVDRLGRLVADLLTLARLEAGSLELTLAPEFVTDLLGGVSAVMQTLAEQADVRLSVEIADEELRVLADRDRIVQVLLSFTDNALKHSAPGSTVHVRVARAGESVRFEVADEGAGIEAEELSRVFERFYRADSARGGAGTGLGLAIAKEIVEAHGASIEVHSEPGAGTVFSFGLRPA
jgi:PAS domain S-box-containing protein